MSQVQLRRAVASSYLGSVIEYYDFLLYGTASAIVFNKVFFANLDPLLATVASFGTFATGYLARPIGGILFGHFGDLLGRKRMLVLSMTLMGISSFLIGLLPTYASIGGLAPVGLVLLRVIQGIAVGGEWGGSVLMSAEHATSRRGLWASFTNAGAPSGMVLSTIAMTVTSGIVGEQAFLSWGWRIPFLLSILLLAVGLFVRMKVEETPAFKAAQSEAAPRKRLPVLEVLRNHPRNLLLGIGVGLAAFVAQSTLTTFVLAYAVRAGHARQDVLNVLTISSACAIVGILGFSAASDRFGRRPIVLIGALSMAVWSFILFPMVDSRSGFLLLVALVVGQSVIHAMMYGPLAALYSEMFSTENRYTGASLGYQIAGLGAGLAPLLFAEIQRGAGSASNLVISATIAGFCLLAVVCVLGLKETSKQDLMQAKVAS
ncbi:MFS family permease [Kibdelosporangium banguiense]|uniref:MFS family permease n=1 Tax=Kibdelosporangium banguiense TaxID=1365924 RepID=A0ABS4TPK6_9PSEU|nr:MFS transporter [Kibdelosporangium banguiense]MBP2326331.1 MFS family permease [Kibdelosporangium banguiense]